MSWWWNFWKKAFYKIDYYKVLIFILLLPSSHHILFPWLMVLVNNVISLIKFQIKSEELHWHVVNMPTKSLVSVIIIHSIQLMFSADISGHHDLYMWCLVLTSLSTYLYPRMVISWDSMIILFNSLLLNLQIISLIMLS